MLLIMEDQSHQLPDYMFVFYVNSLTNPLITIFQSIYFVSFLLSLMKSIVSLLISKDLKHLKLTKKKLYYRSIKIN